MCESDLQPAFQVVCDVSCLSAPCCPAAAADCTDGNPTKDKNCVLFAKVLRDLVEDVYLNASVDLVVAGHMHG